VNLYTDVGNANQIKWIRTWTCILKYPLERGLKFVFPSFKSQLALGSERKRHATADAEFLPANKHHCRCMQGF
jgi:hypothetical protein